MDIDEFEDCFVKNYGNLILFLDGARKNGDSYNAVTAQAAWDSLFVLNPDLKQEIVEKIMSDPIH